MKHATEIHKKQVEELKQKHSDELGQLETKNSQLLREITDLKKKYEELCKEFESRNHDELVVKNKALHDKITSLEAQLSQMQAEHEEAILKKHKELQDLMSKTKADRENEVQKLKVHT